MQLSFIIPFCIFVCCLLVITFKLGQLSVRNRTLLIPHYCWWKDVPFKEATKLAMRNPYASDFEIADWSHKNMDFRPIFEQFRERHDLLPEILRHQKHQIGKGMDNT